MSTIAGYARAEGSGATPDGYPLPLTGRPLTKEPVVGAGRSYPEAFRRGEPLADDEIRLTCCGSGNPIVRTSTGSS